MVSPADAKATLSLLMDESLADVLELVPLGRSGILSAAPDVIGYYSLGSAALAADFYEDERDLAPVRRLYVADPVVPERAEKIGRALAWATEVPDEIPARLAEVIPIETARAFRQTILSNSAADVESAGWRRIASPGACKLCRMLADRGAVYKRATALFAAHASCKCSAQPVFEGQPGEEASVMQYTASQKTRSAKAQQRLRDYLNTNYPDAHG